MKTISHEIVSDTIIVNKSKFIGFTYILESKKDISKKIKIIQSIHPSCCHIAYAYQLKVNKSIDQYFNDDGEPSGTAGKPLLNILEKKDIINTFLAVIRYYGGVNLGTGGLARAYSKAGMMALSQSKVVNLLPIKIYLINIKYNMLDKISHVIYSDKGIILDKNFNDEIQLHVKITNDTYKKILNLFPLIKIKEITN